MRAQQRLLTGRAWDDFCDIIRLAGRAVDTWGDDVGPLDRAEYYRFLSRVMRNAFERFVENCEPARPRFRDVPWRSTINIQSPDQDHLLCEFDHPYDYRITGRRGTVPYFILAEHTAPQPADLASLDWAALGVKGLDGFDPTHRVSRGTLSSDDMIFDASGRFEIIASLREQKGNWLPLKPDSLGIIARVMHHRRAEERSPTFQIERIDGPRPGPLGPEDIAAGLAKTAQTVLGYTEKLRAWRLANASSKANRIIFSPSFYLAHGGVNDRQFGFGVWSRQPSQAIVVEFQPPDCEYWIFQLCSIWQENLDVYEDGQGYATKFTTTPADNGTVRLVIADDDPGIEARWIDPGGHTHGIMGLRLIKTATVPAVAVYLINTETLARDGLNALDPRAAIRTENQAP
jgi:hypothetical protein